MEPTFHRRTPQKVITYILRLAKNIHEGRIDLEDVTYVTEEDHRAICSRCDVQKEDVLYIKMEQQQEELQSMILMKSFHYCQV